MAEETIEAHVAEQISCSESPDPNYRIFHFKTDGNGSPPVVAVAVPLALLTDLIASALLGPMPSILPIPE